MKRHPALAPLSRDHHHTLLIASQLRRASEHTARATANMFLAKWEAEESVHFRMEEEVLLPAYAAHGRLDHPAIVRMLLDHARIRSLAASIADAPPQRLHELGERLSEHVRLEEREVFPLIEAALSEQEIQSLGERIEGPAPTHDPAGAMGAPSASGARTPPATRSTVRIAAVQLQPVVGDVTENLRRCRALGDEAGAAGARWIVLPEFFTTGMAFDDALADAALPPGGAATQLLRELAMRHRAVVCGSFICRDEDRNNRNTWLVVSSDGKVIGRHDKDLPTMWENCYYVGGNDDGVMGLDGLSVGAAMCWELMRTATARRLRGRVDLLVAGSAWWSVPAWPPRALSGRWEAANARNAASVAPAMARAIGAPVAHAAHCGKLNCRLPLAPGVRYRGRYEGGACITDAHGGLLAWRGADEGPGIVLADVRPERAVPTLDLNGGFWLHPRGVVPAAAWAYQRLYGRRWYRRNAIGRPPERRSLQELAPQARPSGP